MWTSFSISGEDILLIAHLWLCLLRWSKCDSDYRHLLNREGAFSEYVWTPWNMAHMSGRACVCGSSLNGLRGVASAAEMLL